MNYPAAELRGIKMNFYLINPDAKHRGILLIKKHRVISEEPCLLMAVHIEMRDGLDSRQLASIYTIHNIN